MAELDQEGEQRRVARVKELEEMVKKLENENRQLLNKVRDGDGESWFVYYNL